MSIKPLKKDSARWLLKNHTKTAHEALHAHPWISQLTNVQLQYDTYQVLIRSYLMFYRHIEKARDRLNVYEELNLRHAISNLEIDSGGYGNKQKLSECFKVDITSKATCLGALYVLHDSQFGASIMNKQVKKSLPRAFSRILEESSPLDQWSVIINKLESFDIDSEAFAQLLHCANTSFISFGN